MLQRSVGNACLPVNVSKLDNDNDRGRSELSLGEDKTEAKCTCYLGKLSVTTRKQEAKTKGQASGIAVSGCTVTAITTNIMVKETNDEQPEQCPSPAHHLGKTVCGDVLASRLAQQQLHHDHDDHHHHHDSSVDSQHSSPCKAACSLLRGSTVVVENGEGEDDCAVILNHSKKGIIIATKQQDDSTGPSRSILEEMISQLSEEQVDIAAASSYHYECCLSSSSNSSNDTEEQRKHLDILRKEYAMLLASRFWIAEKGNVEMALEKMQAHLTYRTDLKINLIRTCFTRLNFANDEEKQEAAEMRRKIRKFLLGPGGSGRVFHRGYDMDGRVCVHSIARNTPLHNRTDQEGYMESAIFILEKSLACSSKKSRQKQNNNNNNMSPRQRLDDLKMIASVNFEDFQSWHNLPISANRDLLNCLQNHYPETLHRMYFCDAPLLFRAVWTILKPFIDPDTKAKLQFVTGNTGKQAVFHNDILPASQTMPYQRPDALLTNDVDMEHFFNLPLDQAYDEE